jgi:hypothetical protein
VGLSRRKAAVSLWGLSGLYSLVAVYLSKPNQDFESILILGAGLLWLLLFGYFSKIKDS